MATTTPSPTHGITTTTAGSENQWLVATCTCGWERSTHRSTPGGLAHATNAHRRAAAKGRAQQ